MTKNIDKTTEKGKFVYKSVMERHPIQLPDEYYYIVKLEAKRQRRTMKEVLVDAIRLYMKKI